MARGGYSMDCQTGCGAKGQHAGHTLDELLEAQLFRPARGLPRRASCQKPTASGCPRIK